MKLALLGLVSLLTLSGGPDLSFPVSEIDVQEVESAQERGALDAFQLALDRTKAVEQLEEDAALAGSLAPALEPEVEPALEALARDLLGDAILGTPEVNPDLNFVTRDDPAAVVALAALLTATEVSLLLEGVLPGSSGGGAGGGV